MTKYVKVSDFFYHVINYSLFTSGPEIDLIFLLNLVNFNLPRDFFRQNSELGEIAGKGSKSCNQGLPRLGPVYLIKLKILRVPKYTFLNFEGARHPWHSF